MCKQARKEVPFQTTTIQQGQIIYDFADHLSKRFQIFFSQPSIYVTVSIHVLRVTKILVKSQLWKFTNLTFFKSFWLHCGRLNGDATLFMLEKANVVLIMISDTFHLGWQT